MSARPNCPIKLYSYPLSGHAYRVRLFLSLLGIPYELIDVDLRKGEQKEPAFLQLNAFGQVPVFDDGGVVIADSNAILIYVATLYGDGGYLPTDAVGAAQVQRWLSVVAGPMTYGPAKARRLVLFGGAEDASAIQIAQQLFVVMDAHLAERDYLTGTHITIADIAAYAYVAHAPEGNIDLAPYSHLSKWLGRVEALPGFIPMQRSQVGLWA